MRPKIALAFFLLPVCASAHSPLFNILGSYFPGWMLCFLSAILLSVLVRLLARRLNFDDHMEPALITYVAMTLLFSFTLWLILFS
jgi:hypothetical protein